MIEPVIVFTIPGMPRGKGRGRPVKRGAFLSVINDDASEAYQNRINNAADRAMRAKFGDDYRPIDGPLELRVLCRFPIPASASARRKEQMRAGLVKPTRKPDLSNALKAVEDGMNKVVWLDDAQVTDLRIRKVYADLPGVDVSVRLTQ